MENWYLTGTYSKELCIASFHSNNDGRGRGIHWFHKREESIGDSSLHFTSSRSVTFSSLRVLSVTNLSDRRIAESFTVRWVTIVFIVLCHFLFPLFHFKFFPFSTYDFRRISLYCLLLIHFRSISKYIWNIMVKDRSNEFRVSLCQSSFGIVRYCCYKLHTCH